MHQLVMVEVGGWTRTRPPVCPYLNNQGSTCALAGGLFATGDKRRTDAKDEVTNDGCSNFDGG